MATERLIQMLTDSGFSASGGRSNVVVQTTPGMIAIDVARVQQLLADVAVLATVVGRYDGKTSQITITGATDAMMSSRPWTSIRQEAARLFAYPTAPTERDVRRFDRRCVANAEAESARRSPR